MFRADNFDQDSGESRHGNVDQIANRKVRGLEVDADRRADFQIDEQEKAGAKLAAASADPKSDAKRQAALQGAGITPVSSSLFLDVDSLLLSLDSQGRFFSHDKIEGVAALDGGHEIVISNDSDFGISGVTNAAPPWQLQAKISPATGQQDDGEYLEIDPDKLSPASSATPSTAQTSTATVTIHVAAGH